MFEVPESLVKLLMAWHTRQAPKPSDPVAPPFHGLRATFVTGAMRGGQGDGWSSDRTSHLTPEMRYAHAARTLADLKCEPFPDIAKGIPELAELPANVVPLARSGH